MPDVNQGRGDLVLAPGEYAYVLDTTKGQVTTYTGPHKVSMSNTDQTVVWDRATRRIKPTDMERAKQIFSVAPEGFYIVLFNPADKNPVAGTGSPMAELRVGQRVIIPGPVSFPLWPGQFAEVIRGHHLRSNQFLIAEVYNDEQATANWKTGAVVKPQGDGETTTPATTTPEKFTLGQQLVIKGTDVAFFMPPTGVKVVPEAGSTNKFVREAVTLERLEYCILLDEDGNKRFVRGPDVVFPEPTENFVEKEGSRKFKAIELNQNSGLYIKVIADYEDDSTSPPVKRKAGDELFITGEEQAIYFQREEHAIIRYGDQTKHYAVAVPPGEGRYVLNRIEGDVKLERGPKMLLPDPRTQLIVRRVLSEKTVRLWYPGNEKVVQINKELENLNKDPAAEKYDDLVSYDIGRPIQAMALAEPASNLLAKEDRAYAKSRSVAGDTLSRGTKFTPPRTVTLDTKYEGAVSITIWPGYAVLIVNKTGERRVVEGPETVLLEYDETLAVLELSTGTPKVDTPLLQTVYLRVGNNKISDRFTVETKDLVKIELTVSYRVNFEGENKERWFAVENYVRLLCDHMRSLIRNTAKRQGVAEFYGNTIDIVRDAALGIPGPIAAGGKRPGKHFEENDMHVYDVEVLDVSLKDPAVSTLLGTAQKEVLVTTLETQRLRRELEATEEHETLKQKKAAAQLATAIADQANIRERTAAQLASNLAAIASEAEQASRRLANDLAMTEDKAKINQAEIDRMNALAVAEQENARRTLELQMNHIIKETEELAKRAGAVSPALAQAIITMSDQALVAKLSEHLAPLAAMQGVSAADIMTKMFKDTPLEGVMSAMASRARTVPALPH